MRNVPACMDRYYFHAHFDDGFERDRVGHECATLDDAIVEAGRTRAALMTALELDELDIEITDEAGHTLATLPRAPG